MGYTALASLMGKHPEVAIFRRFSSLNVRNLLYFQAELVQLEIDLRKKQEECAASRQKANPNGNSEALIDWQDCSLKHLKNDKTQWEIFQEIREKLKDYSKFLSRPYKIG